MSNKSKAIVRLKDIRWLILYRYYFINAINLIIQVFHISSESGKLTTRELRVVMALEEAPMATYKELGEKANIAKSVLYNIVKSLEEPEHRDRPYFRVVAHPNLKNLALQIVDIIATAPSKSQLEVLDEVCLQHYYTAYRSYCFGDQNGMLIQFRLPRTKENTINQLFQELQNRGIVEDYQFLVFPSPQIYSHTNVSFWQPETWSWDFSWETYFGDLPDVAIDQANQTYFLLKQNSTKKTIPIRSWLKREDIEILTELFSNSRQRNIDMMASLKKKGYDYTPQNFSRRLNRIKKICVERYRVFLDPHCTDVFTPILVWGTGDMKVLYSIREKMRINPVPFTSMLKTFEKKFFWYIHLPSTQISDFMKNMRSKVEIIHFNYIDHPSARSFLPYGLAYDEKKKNWKSSQKLLVTDILDHVDKYCKDRNIFQ